MTVLRTILSLCDHTGNWSRPYLEAGYDVLRVDLKDGQDVRFLRWTDRHVHGILAAPPCTVFASSGARWQRTDEEMAAALALVDACLRAVAIYRPAWWALENPVGKLVQYLGPPRLRFDPWWYGRITGDAYTKRTCLWGQFRTPERDPVQPTEGSRMHLLPPSEERAALRSATPLGFAYAFKEANP